MGTIRERIANRRKKLDEEKNNNSLSIRDKIKKASMEKEIDFDTFQSDLSNINNTVNGIYNSWQDESVMSDNRESIVSMRDRLSTYRDYMKLYGGGSDSNIDSIVESYNTVVHDWDNLTSMYGQYKDADSYSKAMEKFKFDKDFEGLTYDEVQAKMKEYGEDSAEYDYLSEYTGYSSMEDFEKALKGTSKEKAHKLKTAMNKFKLDNASEPYMYITEEEDYAEKSKYVPSKENGGYNETYEYINDVDGARMRIQANHDKMQADSVIHTPLSYVQRGLDMMNDTEKGIFNSLYADDPEKAFQYLNDIEQMLTKRATDATTQAVRGAVDDSAGASVALSLVSPLLNIGGGIYGAVENVGSLLKGEAGNPYSIYNGLTNMSSDIRSEVSENIAEGTEGMEFLGANVPSFLYNTGMSMADSALGASTLGKAYTPLMGMSAYQQTAKELTDAGASEDEVVLTALISGVAEAGFEYIGIDKLFNIKNSDSIKSALKNAVKQAGAEGGEEIGTEIVNIIADTLVRGGNSEYQNMYNDLLDRGFTEKEAYIEIAKNIGSRVVQAGIGGALSGSAMGGAFSFIQHHDLSKTGAGLRENERVQDIMDMFTPEEAETYKLYTAYADKDITADTIKDAQLGNLYATKEADAVATLKSKKSTAEQKEGALRTLDTLNTYRTTRNTQVAETGEKVDIKGVKKVDGETVLVTSNGEMSAKDVTLSDNDTAILSYAEEMDEKKANLFVEQYDKTSNVEDYKLSFEFAYERGMKGFTMNDLMENRGTLTERQALEIYKATVQAKTTEKQQEIEALSEKHGKNLVVTGTCDDSIIDYNNITTDGSKVRWDKLTINQRSAVRFAKAFSKATGANIVFTDKGMQEGFNGKYENNTITLDIYAGIDKLDGKHLEDAIIPTLSHEVTHWMKDKSPAMYRQMLEYTMETMQGARNLTVNALVAEEIERIEKVHPEMKGKVTDEYAMDEILARACEDMISNSDATREMLKRMSEDEKQTFIDKVKSTFENLMNWVNDLLGKYKSSSKEAQILGLYKDRVTQLSKMWDKALAEAIQTNQAMQLEGKITEGNVSQLSDRDSEDNVLTEAQIEYFKNSKARDEDGNLVVVYHGTVREFYTFDRAYGNPEGNMGKGFYFTNSLVDVERNYANEDGADLTNKIEREAEMLEYEEEYEGMEHEEIVEALRKKYITAEEPITLECYLDIKNPCYVGSNTTYLFNDVADNYDIDDYDDEDDYYADVDQMAVDYVEDAIGAIYREGYDADGVAEILYEAIVDGGIELEDLKARLSELYLEDDNGNLISSELARIIVESLGYDGIIDDSVSAKFKNMGMSEDTVHYIVFNSNQAKLTTNETPTDNQDIRYSDRDSEGTRLAPEQIDYFQDSKIRDNNGSLKVMFHGSGASFTVFDKKKAKTSGYYGSGFYFTESETHAKQYGSNYKVYLNITNPIQEGTYDITKDQFKKFVQAVADNEDYGIENYGYGVTVNSVVNDIYGKDDFAMIMDINASCIGDMVEAIQLFNEVNGTTYDGIIAPTETVAFYPNQIKNVNNLKPTEDEDIRFSDRNLYLNEADIEEYLNAGTRRNKNRRSAYENGENIIINNKEDLQKFVSDSLNLIIRGKTVAYGRVGDELADKVYNKSNGKIDIHGFFLELSSDDLHHSYDGHKTPKRKDNLPMSEQDMIDAIIKVNSAEVENIEYHKDNRTDLKLSLRNVNDRVIVIELVSLSAGSIRYKTGWKEVDNKKRNSVNSVGNDSSNPNSKLGSTRDTSASNNIIPQSTENKTTNFSDRNTQSIYDLLGENKHLKKQNEILEADVERLKLERQLTNGNNFNENQLDAVAGHIRHLVNSSYDKATLKEELRDMYTFIATSPQLDWTDVMAKSYDIARNVLGKSKGYKITNDYFKDVLGEIRKARITLSEEQIQEAKNAYGERYRDAFMGRVMLVKNGTPLDQKWQEWSSMYPEIFDADIMGGDQITELSSIYDALRDGAEYYQQYNDVESIRSLAVEIYNQYWNVSTIRTTADKYDKQIKRLNFEHRKAMSELRSGYKQKVENQKLADSIHYGKVISDIRKGRDAEIKRARELGKKRLDSYKVNAEKKNKIERIKKNVKTLNEYLVKNSKDKHISDELKEPVRNFLNSIDYDTRKSGSENFDHKDAIAKLEKNVQEARKNVDLRANLTALQMSVSEDEMLQRAGVDFSSDIEELTKNLGKMDLSTQDYFVLKDMSLEDVTRLDKIIRTLKTVITRANHYCTLRRKLTISESAHELFNLFDSLGEVKEGKLDGILDFFNYDNVTPINFFDRLGDVGKDLFKAFVRGQSRQAFNIAEAKKFSDSLCSDKKKHEWDTDFIEFEIVDVKKTRDVTKPVMKKVYTTTSRLMTLYLHDQREQSQGHLYKGGGGRFTTFEHKGKTYGEDVNGVALTPQLVQQMLTKLEPEAKEVADKISVYLNTVCKELGNEVTKELYDVELFLEPKYIPIEVIKESVSRKMDKLAPSITALLNKGFTKETRPSAKNQIVLDSIFDVFAKHTAEMITYNAYAREVYDAVRLFEYNENRQTYVLDGEEGQTVSDNIQIAMRGALGNGAVKYFRNFLEDVNGTQQAGRGNDFLSKAFSNSKLANVAWNINVVLIQPTALIRAMITISPKYLAKGLFGIKSGMKSAMEHSGTALYKSLGFYDTDISLPFAEQIKGAKTFGDKMKEASMKGAEFMDKVTWGTLWKACEYKVLAENKGLKRGSEEFYDKVVEIFDETVYRTQVMDSTLSRSQIMRDKNAVKKGLTSFMAEPLLAYNTVYGVFSEWNQYSRQGHTVAECSKKCGKKLAVSIGAYCLGSLAEAGIRTLTTAMRNAGSDEEEDENVFLEQLFSALNPLSKIPVVREVISALQGYGVSAIPGLNTIETFVNAYKTICKIIVDGEEVSYKKVHKLLKAVSYASGHGISNAYRDIIAIWNSTIGQMYPSLIIDTDE